MQNRKDKSVQNPSFALLDQSRAFLCVERELQLSRPQLSSQNQNHSLPSYEIDVPELEDTSKLKKSKRSMQIQAFHITANSWCPGYTLYI